MNMFRKSLFCCYVAFFPLCLNAQSSLVSELSEALVDVAGSFLDNPYHHSNTIKVFENTKELKNAVDLMYSEAIASNHPKAKEDIPYLVNMSRIIKCLDDITGNIAGYSRGGFSATEFDSILPLFTELGWTREVLFSTSDIVLYEFKKDNFRMVLANNIRPKKEGGDYNACSYQCYTWIPSLKEHHAFIKRIVFGGNYQLVEYGDDTTKYRKISKMMSKRGTEF